MKHLNNRFLLPLNLQLFADTVDLKGLLGDELHQQLMDKLGDKHKVALVSDGSYIPKDTFNQVNEAKKKLEGDVKDRDKQLEDLKKSASDNAALQEQITKLQTDNKAASEKYDADMKDLRTNTALKLALAGQVHDPDIVTGLLDKTKLILADDGKVSGLDDQIKALRESKAFLFVPENDGKPKFKGAIPPDGKDKGGGGGDTSIGADFAKAANESGKAPSTANDPWNPSK